METKQTPGLCRDVERWRGTVPNAMANQSVAAVAFAFEDARHDILLLAAQRDELLSALQGCVKALDAIGDEMTVGERYTEAGQYLLDALPPARDAIARSA